jgi:hypothetical protein
MMRRACTSGDFARRDTPAVVDRTLILASARGVDCAEFDATDACRLSLMRAAAFCHR